jgi:hypothetical protein
MRYYIAYGSNLNSERMQSRCPGAKIAGTFDLEGYELMFRKSRTGYYLTIDKKPGGSVPCAVYEVTDGDEETLDRCEGWPDCYGKEFFDIDVPEKGKLEGAFIYMLPEDRPCGLPSDEYMDICAKGYEELGFDAEKLRSAYERSAALMEE